MSSNFAPASLAYTALLRRDQSISLYEALSEPKNVWKYFLLLTETPRPSHKLERATEVMLKVAELLKCDAEVDQAGNIRLRKPASKGYENSAGICIQAHLDMVTSANSDIVIDFDKDPINVMLTEDGTWMKAKGTTLGADNGIGVAAGLALLEESDSFDHGQLELLITADEETTMGGAENLAPHPYLTSDILLNVDSEEEYSICIGCAGGHENTFSLAVDRSQVPNGFDTLRISIKGLKGGHSGIDINEGRANAHKCLSQILRRLLEDKIDARLVCLYGDGAPNVIPRESAADIAVPTAAVNSVKAAVAGEVTDSLQKIYSSVETTNGKSNFDVSVEASTTDAAEALSAKSTGAVIDMIETFHSGVIRMNYDVAGLVETSTNLASIKLEREGPFQMHAFARSSLDKALVAYQRHVESFARQSGAQVTEPLCGFPGWQPDVSSKALAVLKEAHKEVMKRDARVYAVHAGLECGLIQAVYPKIACVSIGPEILGAHSPDERLNVPSLPRFYTLARRFIVMMASAAK